MSNISSNDGDIFRVEEETLHNYLTEMHLDDLFGELVEELLIEGPNNPVQFIIDYLFNQYPEQAQNASFAKTFGRYTDITGGGVPLTGLQFCESIVETSDQEDNDDSSFREEEENDSRYESSNKSAETGAVRKNLDFRMATSRRRRAVVLGSNNNPQNGTKLDAPQKVRLMKYLVAHHIFSKFNEVTLEAIVKIFQVEQFKSGDVMCTINSDVEKFFFIANGNAQQLVDGKLVSTLHPGDCVGESALLHGGQHPFDIVSSSPTTRVFFVSAGAYKESMRQVMEAVRTQVISSLRCVRWFQVFTELELLRLADDVAVHRRFAPGDIMVRQHEPSSEMYIIISGRAKCEQRLSPTEPAVEIVTFEQNDYFGEIALICDRPYTATVTAVSHVQSLEISRSRFANVFGSLTELLKRDISLYKTFVSDKI